jgi:hypothetical protein
MALLVCRVQVSREDFIMFEKAIDQRSQTYSQLLILEDNQRRG